MTKTLLVVGATGGIGAAVARAGAQRGFHILAAGRHHRKLSELCDTIDGATPVNVDFDRPDELPEPLARVGRLDAIVHCAGAAEVATVDETSPQLWERTFQVNVHAPAMLTRALLPALRRAAGHVVFVNGAPGLHAVPRWSAYAGSKAALRELADSLRAEEAPNRIRVTTVYPAGTATGLLRKVRSQFGQPYDPSTSVQPKTVASVIVNVLEMDRDAYLSEVSILPTSLG
jgi:NADP-dependent 3-hydroxy acid dehydrogenase YdfG